MSITGKVTEDLNLEMKGPQVHRIKGYSTAGESPADAIVGIGYHYMDVSGGSSENIVGVSFIVRTIWDCRYEILQGALTLLNSVSPSSTGKTATTVRMKVDDSELEVMNGIMLPANRRGILGVKSAGFVRVPKGCFYVGGTCVGLDKINLFAFPASGEARELEVDADSDFEWRIYLEEPNPRNVKRVLKDMRTDRVEASVSMRWNYFISYLRAVGLTVIEVNGVATVTHGTITHHVNQGEEPLKYVDLKAFLGQYTMNVAGFLIEGGTLFVARAGNVPVAVANHIPVEY